MYAFINKFRLLHLIFLYTCCILLLAFSDFDFDSDCNNSGRNTCFLPLSTLQPFIDFHFRIRTLVHGQEMAKTVEIEPKITD